MKFISVTTFKSIFGELKIGDLNGNLCMLDWKYRAKRLQIDKRVNAFFNTEFREQETPLHQTTILQLKEYFGRQRTQFDLPLLFAGSEFQIKVWDQLRKIPYGKTVSYMNLSKLLGDEKAIRAVASANGDNALSIVVPCHRVIGSSGELTGYAGGINTKKQLLQLEGIYHQQELFKL